MPAKINKNQDQKNKLRNNIKNITLFCSTSSVLLLISKRKYEARFFNIFVANEVKRIFVKEHNHRLE